MKIGITGKISVQENQQQQNRKGDEYKQLPDQYRQSRDEAALSPLRVPETKKEAIAAPKNELFKNPAFTARIAAFSGDSSKSLLTQAKTSKGFQEGIQHYSEATWQRLFNKNPNNAVAELCSAAEKGNETAVITLVKEVLQSERSSGGDIVDVLETLAKVKPIDSDILEVMARYLNDLNPHIRIATISAFEAIKPQDPKIHQVIVESLRDKDWSVRQAAVQALKAINPQDPKIHQAIAQHLENPYAEVRQAALQALAAIKPQVPKIRQAIAQCLEDENWFVRQAAVDALTSIKLQDQEIHQFLVQLLQRENREARQAAVRALAFIKPQAPGIHQAIAQCLSNEYPRAREAAIQALAAIKPQDPKIHQAIAQCLEDRSEYVRNEAANFFRDEKVKETLLSFLDLDAESRKTVDMARNLLMKFHPNDPTIQSKLEDIEREISLEREEMPGAAWLFDSSKQLYNYLNSWFKK